MYRIAVLILALTAAGASALDDRAALQDVALSARASLVHVVCRDGQTNRGSRSQGVILAEGSGSQQAEVILTTAHAVRFHTAVPGQCWIVDAQGLRYEIAEVAPSSAISSANGDWAFILTDIAFAEDAARLPVARWAEQDVGARSVALLGSDFLEADCKLSRGENIAVEQELVFLHDCGSRVGLNGAPLLAMSGGQIAVIGINAGLITGSASGGYAVVFDGGLIAATLEGTLLRASEGAR